MRHWCVFLILASAPASCGYPATACAQLDRPAPPVVGYVKGESVYAVEVRKQPRTARFGSFDLFLVQAPLQQGSDTPAIHEYELIWLTYRDRFIPWRLAQGSVWLTEGQTPYPGPPASMHFPEADLRYYEPAYRGDPKIRTEYFRKKYGAHFGLAKHWDLREPATDGAWRGSSGPRSTIDDRHPCCYYDAIVLPQHRTICVTLASEHISVWHGEPKGPREIPNYELKWTRAGKEGKAGFQEPFVLFPCGKEIALVTQAGKAYLVKVPAKDDEAVRVEPIWVGVSRPLAAIVTDADRGISYAFTRAAPGRDRGVYFALSDTDRRTGFDVPEATKEIDQVLAYARILLRDGKLQAPPPSTKEKERGSEKGDATRVKQRIVKRAASRFFTLDTAGLHF